MRRGIQTTVSKTIERHDTIIHIFYSSYCGLDEFIPSIQKLVLKHALVGKAKDPKKDGIPCYKDSGTPLFMKKGKRYVQIGMK